MKAKFKNNLIQILLIPSIIVLLTFITIPYLDVIFAEEVRGTIPVGDSPIGLNLPLGINNFNLSTFEAGVEEQEGEFSAINSQIFSNNFLTSPNKINKEQSNRELSFNSNLSSGLQDNSNIKFVTTLPSVFSKIDIPSMPLMLTQSIIDYVTNDINHNLESSNKGNDLANHNNNNPYNMEGTLTRLGNNYNNNLDNVSVKESEKMMIQHNPGTDDLVVDPSPSTLLSQVLQVLQTPNSECDKCFASESVGGTLPPKRVVELETYLADPANTVPIGADPDVNTIAELCSAIVGAVGTVPISEQDIRNLLDDALESPPPGQIQQVIDCLVLAGLISTTQQEIVVDTTLDSATDGNEDPVENLSSTTSNDIEFEFSGQITPEGTEVDSQGFQCRLDEQPNFVPCNGPTTNDFTGSQLYTNLSPGTHTFEVRAFVVVNEQTIVDLTPVTFTWTIVPIVVDTTLDAIDGNDDTITDGDSTTSNDIEFTFSGEVTNADPEVFEDQGFICTIDGDPIDECGSPLDDFTGTEEFLNLPLGDHTFTVAAFIVINQNTIIDPEPESITWTIEEDNNDNNPPPTDNNPPPTDNNPPPTDNNPPPTDNNPPPTDNNPPPTDNNPPPTDNNPPPTDNNPPPTDNKPSSNNNKPSSNNNKPSSNNNKPSSEDGPSQVPNEAGGKPETGITPFGNGPTGASPFSPITPVGIDPSIPRDISVFVQQYKKPGPINVKYGTQVGNQCLLQLDRDLLIDPENMSKIRDQILNSKNMSLFSKENSLLTLDGQLDIYGEISLSNTTSGNQITNSTMDNDPSHSNSTTKFQPKNKTESTIQLLDLITIGNVTIAKIDNCNQTTLETYGNFSKLDLANKTNVTKEQPAIHFNATTNNSLNSSSAFPSSGLNLTWDENLPNNIQGLTNNTINITIDNSTEQMEENSFITKQTLSNVTFYQFTPLDISRTLLNETINNLVNVNNTQTSIGSNQKSQLVDQNQTNKTGALLQAGSQPIDIVIVDTGVSLTHPDLSVYRSLSFVNGNLSSDPDMTDDKNGHGSHIAGIINAKDNGFGIVGIIPEDNIRIWSMKVCGDDGICSLSDQIKAIEYITNNADILDIVNYSIENPYSKLLERSISESAKAGITYVAAAGNFGKNATLTTSPASNPDVITVSAIGDSDGKCGGLGPLLDNGTMMDDTFANFSNFGPSIDIAAPGVDILSTFNGSDYGILTGTSMAVPHVTGFAGYLKSINPNASPDDIRKMITKSGSSPSSQCQENKGIGYFKGDLDELSEPLLVLPKQLIRDDSIVRADIINATKQELQTKILPTTKTNATKQELQTKILPTTKTTKK